MVIKGFNGEGGGGLDSLELSDLGLNAARFRMDQNCMSASIPKKTRKQNYQTCEWCVKRGIVPPHKGARVGPFRKHCHACEAQFLMETRSAPGVPSVTVIYEMLMIAREEIAKLQAWKARVEKNRKDRSDRAAARANAITAKQCWARRRQHIQQIRHVFGDRKFRMWFNPEIIDPHDILAAVMIPALEMRDGKLCLKGVATTDVYHIGKQIWGKDSTNVDLYWFKEECEKMGITLNHTQFRVQNEEVELAYTKFSRSEKRGGSTIDLPQGLVRIGKLWRKMGNSFGAFEDELWDADGTILDRVPPPELLQYAAGQ